MASATNLSRHDLKKEHRRVCEIRDDLEKKLLELRASLNRFADGYHASEEHFPWSRSKILHELVESITSYSTMQTIQTCLSDSSPFQGVTDQPRGTIPQLLTKIDAINALRGNKLPSTRQGQGEGEKRPLIKSKGKQIFHKIKKMSGFHDQPIEDEDVMTNEKLFFNLKTKERQIKSLHLEFHTVSTALIKLRDDYATVRTQCSFCCRYYKLKNIIETAIEETEAETRYER